jgi:hypothetical protein
MFPVSLNSLCAAHTVHRAVQHTLYTVLCSTHCVLCCTADIVHCAVQHTLHTDLLDISFFPPTTTHFCQFLYSEITRQSAQQVLFRPPSLTIEGHQNLAHFNSRLLISRTVLPHTGSSCIYFVCI